MYQVAVLICLFFFSSIEAAPIVWQANDTIFNSAFLTKENAIETRVDRDGPPMDIADWFKDNPQAAARFAKYGAHQRVVFYARGAQIVGTTSLLLAVTGYFIFAVTHLGGAHISSATPPDFLGWMAGLGLAGMILPYPLVWIEQDIADRHLRAAINIYNGVPEPLSVGLQPPMESRLRFSYQYRF